MKQGTEVSESTDKALHIAGVSQQRKLLIAFLEWEHASSIDLSDENYMVDEFLKATNGG